jgi:hypothetical protein
MFLPLSGHCWLCPLPFIQCDRDLAVLACIEVGFDCVDFLRLFVLSGRDDVSSGGQCMKSKFTVLIGFGIRFCESLPLLGIS